MKDRLRFPRGCTRAQALELHDAWMERMENDRMREFATSLTLGASEHDWDEDRIAALLEDGRREWVRIRAEARGTFEAMLDEIAIPHSNLLH